jgi:hypothetical protein
MVIGGGAVVLIAAIIVVIMLSKRDKSLHLVKRRSPGRPPAAPSQAPPQLPRRSAARRIVCRYDPGGVHPGSRPNQPASRW